MAMAMHLCLFIAVIFTKLMAALDIRNFPIIHKCVRALCSIKKNALLQNQGYFVGYNVA